MMWIWIGAGAVLLFFFWQMIHLTIAMTRGDQETVGLAYYGRPPAERAAFKQKLGRQARLLAPVLRLLGRFSKFTFDKASFEVQGLRGPLGTCDAESFEKALAYRPRPEDVFVVTQMKCGTTWMQHVVYETLRRGKGDLAETGTALYAVSPWIEARKSVSIEDAPLIGEERASRIIKTHLPASHCPLDPAARYIYVARHPVSCFASSADFIRANAGPLQPPLDDLELWFTSSNMWWGPWPSHVNGWWALAQREDNVLFVRFEDMKRDLASVVVRVAAFLGVRPLSEDELAEVVRKCGFEYMSEHREAFEMHPPHLFAVDPKLFVRGTADRHRDVSDDVAEGIVSWCRQEMAELDVPLGQLYPETERGASPRV